MKTARLKSLVGSVKNGAWGDECGDGAGTYCIRAADFDYVRLRASLARAPKRAYPATVVRDIRLQPGDLVLEKSGGGENQPVGRAVLYDGDEPAVVTNFAARLRPAPGVDPKYLTYVLAGLYASGATERCIKQTTGIQNLDTQAWLQTPVLEVPLDAQRQIADFLDDQVARIDEVIRLRAETIDVLGERLAADAHGEVTGIGYTDRAATDLAWSDFLPSHWPVARLGLIAEMGTGHTPSRLRHDYWENTDIPWLTTTDVKHLRSDEIETLDDTEVHISAVGLRNSAAVMHPAGTVGICRTSASAGYSAIMGVPMATSQDFAVWRPAPEIVPGYLLWCLRVMRTDVLERLAMGSTHKTIYFPDLEGIQIPLPPVAEQADIAGRMHRTVGLVAAARAELRAEVGLLRERKRSLITAAVTGEFDVTSASGRGVA